MPEGDWFIAQAQSRLGGCLSTLGRFDEAEPLLLEGYAGLKATRGDQDEAIAQVATFKAPGAGSSIVYQLDTTDFVLEYLDLGGAVIGDPVGNFNLIRYVQVRVVDFEHQLLIPFAQATFTMPEFVTTLPRESLGVPRDGVITPC